MLAITDTPTIYEWIALLQRDPEEAQQLAISLKTRMLRDSLLADPALTISLEDYQRAQQLLAKAKEDAATMQRVAHMARLGQATLGPVPGQEDWAAMIEEDPQFARSISAAWEVKCAQRGIYTPRAILRSLALYRDLVDQKKV
jgi:hypothetical protein